MYMYMYLFMYAHDTSMYRYTYMYMFNTFFQTGYMFGKGVYFADMVSKSANYCHATKSSPVAFLLLCEVALGNM